MKTIEFISISENGIVQIPAQYQLELEGKEVRVTIEERTSLLSSQIPSKKRFQAVELRTRGFRFDRDEANAR